MKNVAYFNPQNIQEALQLLEQYEEKAVIVNGGTDIVEKIAHGTVKPEAVVYIQNIGELKTITQDDGYVKIGGAATYQALLESPLCKPFAALMQSVVEIGSPPIRVVGTPAGNIGTAVPAADCNVAMMALHAEIVLASIAGERTVLFQDMFTGYCKTQMKANEIIKEIKIPLLPPDTATAFVKLAKRKAQDISQVAAAARITVKDGICAEISIGLGAVSFTTVKAYSYEKLMLGKPVADGIAAVKSTVPDEAVFRSPRNKAYKEAVTGVLAARAIQKAYAELAARGV